MKTFKFSLVALVATALFTACSNEDAVQPINGEAQEISFRLQGGTPEITTRAMATTLDKLEAFVVFGTDNLFSPGLLLDGVSVARQLDGTFAYAPKAYYSNGAASASFFAFSPVSANISGSVTTTSLLTAGASFDYEVLAPDGTGDAVQEDLLVTATTVTPSTAAVNLTFKHALSRIFVTAQNTANEPVIIKGISLMNLNTTGTLAVTNASALTWTTTPSLDDYAYVLAPSGVVVPGGTTGKTLVTSMEQGMMVLPQVTSNTGAAGDFALEISYDFANLSNQTQIVKITDGYAFVAGNQYNINITFAGLLPIEFDVIDVDAFGAPIDVN
jgi:hypothetical protein